MARLFVFLVCCFAFPTSAALGPHLRGFIGAHDPSTVIKCKDRYYCFSTGTGILSKSSADKVFWKPGPNIFPTPPAWTKTAVPGFVDIFWAPDVIFLNGKYYLYYSISTFGSQVSAIGLATNPTLDPSDPAYQWTDQGMVISSQNGNSYNTIDPSVFLDTDGKLWMTFGSYWNGIYLVQLNTTTGLRIAVNSPLTHLAFNGSIEASCLMKRGGFYYLFVNWGSCCSGVKSEYNIRMGRATSVTGPYLDRNGTDLRFGGGSLFMNASGKYTRPGHVGILQENGEISFSYHYYDANAFAPWYGAYGVADFDLQPLAFSADAWPTFTNEWSANYKFDADARDENGQYDGLLQGNADIVSDAGRGRVLSLNGTNAFVTLPPGVAYARTFAGWVKWNGGPAWQRIFDFGVDAQSYVMVTPFSNLGRFRCDIRARGITQTVESLGAFPLNTWTYFAVTFDGARGTLYLNGSAVATNLSMNLLPLEVRAQTNHLGRSKFSADPDFRGQIGTFQVFAKTLSREEIVLAMQESAGATNPPPSQIARYEFNVGAEDWNRRFNATLLNGASVVNDVTRGNVLNLSGASQYLNLPLVATNFQTFAAWVKWNGGASWQRVFDFGADTEHWCFFTPKNGAGQMEFAITAAASVYVQNIQGATTFPTNTWTHLAVALDGRQAQLFLNGKTIGVNNSVNLLPSDISATRAWVGRSQFAADAFFAGRVDSIKLDSRALSLVEVSAQTLELASDRSLKWLIGDADLQPYYVTNLGVGEIWKPLANPEGENRFIQLKPAL